MIQAENGRQSGRTARQVLLFCGVLSALVYIVADILAARRWEAYSYASQMVSELMAIGAPTRPFLVRFFTLHNLLMIAFAIGVLGIAGRKGPLRYTGRLLAAYGIVGQAALLFAPMHLRGAERTLTDSLHQAATIVIVILTLSFIGFGAAAFGKRFRLFSVATILVLFVFGALAGLQGPRIAANLPTPWFGVMERVNIYGTLLWTAVLALALLRSGRAQDPR